MSGPSVTIVPSGGTPVTVVYEHGTPVTLVESGGAPITVVPNGPPVILGGVIPPDPPLGPLDVVGRVDGYFTNFSQQFTLEADCAVVGLCCNFSGDPVITIKHGEDTLTILKQERSGGLLSLLAFGTGLTIETANVSITATGGELNGGAMRISEVYDTSALGSVGWIDGAAGTGNVIDPAFMQDQIGGVVKGALVHGAADRYHTTYVNGSDIVWSGFTTTGVLIATDTSITGDWILGAGWSRDGNEFVHTGPETYLEINFPLTTEPSSARMELTVEDGQVYFGAGNGGDRYDPGHYFACTAARYGYSKVRIYARGNCRLQNVSVVQQATWVSWVFCTTPALAGGEIEFVQTHRPDWAYSLSEVACPEGPDSNWILTDGDWNDSGVWIDNQDWND